MKLDINKTSAAPKDQWEAVRMLTVCQIKLVQALHIMNSVIEDNNDEEDRQHNDRQMKDFIKQFELAS